MRRYVLLLGLAALTVVVGMVLGCGGGRDDAAAPVATAASGGAAQGMERVIVVFRGPRGAEARGLISSLGRRVTADYHLIPAVAATVTPQELSALKALNEVAYVEPDAIAQATEAVPWGVARIKADQVWPSGNTGTGVKVGIIDSGIDYTHPDLAGNYKGGRDFANNDNDPKDDNGHGTHVAGIVAAASNGTGVIGAAPTAWLYGLKVLTAAGTGYYSWIISALQWCVDNGIKVANMSLGGQTHSASLQAACDAAYAAGVLLVAAAGNDGNAGGTGDNVDYPARYSSVIAVAATDSANARATFSSTGPAVELAAPGVSIPSDWLGGGTRTLSGTSMACPHVAGTAALVWAAGAANATDVRNRMTSTALDLGTAGRDNLYGYGLVDALAAVGGGAPPPPPPPPPPPTTGSIAGKVTNRKTGAAIAGATVSTDTGQTTTTNAQGNYTLTNVPAGVRRTTASATGFLSQTYNVTVYANQTTTRNFALMPSGRGSGG